MSKPTTLVHYEVRTPPLYAAILFELTVLALVAAYVVLPLLPFLFEGHALPLLGGLAIALLPMFYYLVTPEYRAGKIGHSSKITLCRDFIEVPDAKGRPMRFATAALTIRVTHVRVVYTVAMLPVANVPRGSVIELEGGGLKRRISTLTLLDETKASPLLHDLTRIAVAQDPLGPDAATPPQTAYRTAPTQALGASSTEERDALDDALDDELAKMD